MTLATMSPEPEWEPTEAERAAVQTLADSAPALTVTVWGGDWCGDCRSVLPRFAAALERAGIDPAAVEQHPVEKQPDGTKTGPAVDRYGIDAIPTIVFEQDGREVARFVESEDAPAIVELADQVIACTVMG